jgi:glycosyltransferase involved in cell wall biosynthesis
VPPVRVSVLLSTNRPAMLAFALRQVARQRGVNLELVLACHGFHPDSTVLAEFRNISPIPLKVLEFDAAEAFGSVLNQSASFAHGDVLLKMDDDDWYGPDFVSDLLLARRYSGAAMVGCSSEFKFLEDLYLTTRGHAPNETYANFVFGGTMMVESAMFHSIGGFRQTSRLVDAGLAQGVRSAGGAIYRGHGLGYVLRRRRQGHTWDPGLGHFLHSSRVAHQWRGFRPSTLLEAQPVDHPHRVSPREWEPRADEA